MDLYLMQQIKRLFAWADAGDDTRNMELHLQIAFGLVAQQGAATPGKWTLTADELEVRDRPVLRHVQLTQSYRSERARLATQIARGMHCRFMWVGSLTQEQPTDGYFVGCPLHADRARLLFELIDPDLRLLTRFIRPRTGLGSGPEGTPSGDGLDFYASRSAAMHDVISWISERLHDAEAGALAREGLAADFAGDLALADEFIDEMWGDTVDAYDLGAGQPDFPMVDGLPVERFAAFLRELDEGDGDGEGDDYADDDDDFDYTFDFDEEDVDEEEFDGEDEVAGVTEGEDADEGDADGEWCVDGEAETAPLFSLPESHSPADSAFGAATWVYFIEDEAGNDVDPCLIRFGAAGWQLFYPAMDEWFGDPVLEEIALESGLFRSAPRYEAEHWVYMLANPLADHDGFARVHVAEEVQRCIAGGMDEATARHVVRLQWGNLPDALLSE